MASIPRWAMIAVPVVAVAAYGIMYFTDPNVAGRVDECLGTTNPIQRGVMRNTCDHPISVLACPRTADDGECTARRVRANATFEVRADIAIVAHACREPYRAGMHGEQERGCLPPAE